MASAGVFTPLCHIITYIPWKFGLFLLFSIMSGVPSDDDIPSLLFPSLRDHRLSRLQSASKLIKLRSKLRSSTHTAFNLFGDARPTRISSLPNVSQYDLLCAYDKEDESEIASFIQPTFRFSQLALPPRHMFQNHSQSPVHDFHRHEDDTKSLASSCPTWSSHESSEDEDTTVTLVRPATAILVSLPLSSAAAASVARSRRLKSTRIHSSPAMMQHLE